MRGFYLPFKSSLFNSYNRRFQEGILICDFALGLSAAHFACVADSGFLLLSDPGGHGVGTLLPDRRRQRPNTNGDRLRSGSQTSATAQPPGGESTGEH